MGTTLSGGAQNLTVTVPGVGAYLAGNPDTVAHTWCPSGTVGNNASIQFYPQSDSISVPSSVLGATTDGDHILGAMPNGGSSITLNDIGVTIPATLCSVTTSGTPPNQVQTLAALSTNPMQNGFVTLNAGTNVSVTAVNQVVTGAAPTTTSVTTAAPIAFVTYSTPSNSTATAQLPYYLPQPNGSPVVPAGYVTFQYPSGVTATATAPLAGAFSPDQSIFFVSTQGDNEIHFISIPTNVSSSAPPPTRSRSAPIYLPARRSLTEATTPVVSIPPRPARTPSFPPR